MKAGVPHSSFLVRRSAFAAISVLLGVTLSPLLAAGASAGPVAPFAAEENEASPQRPQFLWWVEGSTEENVIWRGWPILVRIQSVTGSTPGGVQLRGTSAIALRFAKGVWFADAVVSERLSAGTYSLTAGGRQMDIIVADPPRDLDAQQRSSRFRLLVWGALLAEDGAGAKQAADAWVQAEPNAFDAREAQGDASRALGNLTGALAAYDEAVKRIPPGIDPPPAGLHAKISTVFRELAAQTPTRPAAAPGAEEVNFYRLVDAGDSALVRDDRVEAARLYAEAEAYRRAAALGISPVELDEKRAALAAMPTVSAQAGGMPGQGSTSVTSTNSVVQPNSPAASSAPLPPVPASAAAAPARPLPGATVLAAEFTDAKVTADPNGQWAIAATAGSQYGKTQYSAAKAVGAPDVPVAGNSPDAWCPAAQNSGTDWLEVSFAKPVHATEVRARQNDKPGAIAKVEAIEPDGTVHVWWEGVDPYIAPASRDIAWFVVRVPRTDYLVAKVKLTLNLAILPGWKEIDAVQLVGANE